MQLAIWAILLVRFMKMDLRLHECEWFDCLRMKWCFSMENIKQKISFRKLLGEKKMINKQRRRMFIVLDVWWNLWPVVLLLPLNWLDLMRSIVGEVWLDQLILNEQKNKEAIYFVLDLALVCYWYHLFRFNDLLFLF